MNNGAKVANTSFTLPDGVEPSLHCEATDFTASGRSPAWLRAMFDRAFQRMAVIVTDETKDAKQATTVDVATGAQGPLPGAADGFASAPKEEEAVFHPTTNDLWFVDHADWQVKSRALPSAQTTSHGKLASNNASHLAIGDRGYFPLRDLQTAAVAPDNEHAVVDDQGSAYMVRVGQLSNDAPTIGGNGFINDKLPGPSAYCETALSWLDRQNLLCDNSTIGESKLSMITFSPTLSSITKSRDDLLPETNRRNFSAVAAPDGKSFAFASIQGHVVTLFRQSLTPGSTPAKVTDLTPPVPPVEGEGSDSVPVLLAWQ